MASSASQQLHPPILTKLASDTSLGEHSDVVLNAEVVSAILSAQLMPFRESLKKIQESIVALTDAVRLAHDEDGQVDPRSVEAPHETVVLDAPKVVQKNTSAVSANGDRMLPTIPGRGGSRPSVERPSRVEAKVNGKIFAGSKSEWDIRAIAKGGGDTVANPWFKRCVSMLRRCVDGVSRHLEEPPRSGRLHSLVSSPGFENLSSMIIMMNALFVAYTSDVEMSSLKPSTLVSPEPAPFILVCEKFFFGWYLIELLFRILVHRCYFFFNKDMKWNLFDFLLVMLSVVDVLATALVAGSDGGGNISFMRIFRLLKLAKILRTLRVMRVFRELAQILESFKNCAISLFWSFVMIVFVIYIFALIFLQGLTNYLKDNAGSVDEAAEADIRAAFGGMMDSMVSLYMAVTGGNDWGYYLDIVLLAGPFYYFLFILFTFFFVFALFNILTGVFVEKAVVAAQPDREEVILEQRRKTMEDAEEFKHLCHVLDKDGTGTISRAEFLDAMESELMSSYMAAVGIEVRDVALFFDLIGLSDKKGTSHDEVSIDKFVDGCMAMKGFATNLEMQKLVTELHKLQASYDESQDALTRRVAGLSQGVDLIVAKLERKVDRSRTVRLVQAAQAFANEIDDKIACKAEL